LSVVDCLNTAFDPGTVRIIWKEKMLHESWLLFYKNRRSNKILVDSSGKAYGVELEDGQVVECDGVILATGYTPKQPWERERFGYESR